jgi:hypothetical protein
MQIEHKHAVNYARGTRRAFWAASPALLALLLSSVFLVVAAVGGTARWLDNDLNLTEAALIGDVGRVYRLLDQGQDIDATYPIRDGKPFKKKVHGHEQLAPLNAALIADTEAVVALLLKRGTAGTPPDLKSVWCMARANGATRTEKWLAERGDVPKDAWTCP